MRPGDLDALTEKLKNGLENAKNTGKENYAKIFEVFIDWVSREPTIDLVPVVRCRECVNHSEVDGYHYCKFWRMYCPDNSDFFCKAGKRKIETVLPKSDAKVESLEAEHEVSK